MDEPPASETTRLCEECGYIVEGLPPGQAVPCPECGTAVPRSRDARRPGTPWQHRRGIGGWAATSWSTLRHPWATFDRVRIDADSARALRTINVGLGGLLLACAALRVTGLDEWPRTASTAGLALAVLTGGTLAGAGVLIVLTEIEARGFRFFGARRGWRITRDIAATICAHASIGWTLAGLLVLVATVPFPINWSPRAGLAARLWHLVWVPSAALMFLAGMMVFECLVYVGVRRCRFANTPDSVSTPPLAPAE